MVLLIHIEYCSARGLPYPEYKAINSLCPIQGSNLYEQTVLVDHQEFQDPNHKSFYTKKDAKEYISKIAYDHLLTQ